MGWGKGHHYSVRQCEADYPNYKIVMAGGTLGYKDLNLPHFRSFEQALLYAERLERLRR